MKTLRRMFCTAAVSLLSCFVFPFYSISASAYVTIEAEIPVYCLEVSDSGNHIYQIKIESENNVSPAPKSDILEITENDTGKFEIDIDEPGTFTYKVYEQPGTDPNVTYDPNIYSVTVFVETNTADDLNYAVVAEIVGKDGKPDNIEFENVVAGANTDSEGETVTTSVPDTTSLPEVTTTSTDTDSSTGSDDSNGSTDSQTAVTTTVTTVTTSKKDNTNNPITGFIDNVLTGDTFPAHAVRTIMLSSILIALSTFLFKRDNNEEEDKNEE